MQNSKLERQVKQRYDLEKSIEKRRHWTVVPSKKKNKKNRVKFAQAYI